MSHRNLVLRPVCGAVLAVSLGLSGCATRQAGSTWGAEGNLLPSWREIGDAALTAATDPLTWAPAAGAIVFQIGDLDNEIAEWAREERPIFGTRERADDASDCLRTASVGIYLGTGLAAPVAPGESWLKVKARGFATGGMAIAATTGIVHGLKEAVGRERPLGQDDRSFPSGHTATSSVGARLSRETLEYFDLPYEVRMATDVGLASLALISGWARIEAGQHLPADVLAGAGIGNFVAVLASEAFLEDRTGEAVTVNIVPYRDGLAVSASFGF